MSEVDVDDYRWLTESEAAGLLAEAAADMGPLHRLAERLRSRVTQRRAHLVLEQAELRRRAIAKFPAAAAMFFTGKSLEQASDFWVAQYKATRLGAAGATLDLCCGIGGDLLSLASSGPTVGVDREPSLVVLAQANLRARGSDAEVHCCGAEEAKIEACNAWHIDPDRRPSGARTSRVEAGEPSTAALDALLARNDAAGVKLAPAAEVPQQWQERSEREWIGRDRQCRQQVVWFGRLAEQTGLHRATVIYRDGRPSASITGQPDLHVAIAPRIGRYLLEPDAAVLAAGLGGHLANTAGVEAIRADVAYFTADEPRDEALYAQFEVLDVLPLDMKQLRRLLRQRGIGQLEVKKRGLPHDPAEVRRALRPQGPSAATLLLTPTPKGAEAILARRLEPM